jgi:imidazolonepropionase-like amidohydrolase
MHYKNWISALAILPLLFDLFQTAIAQQATSNPTDGYLKEINPMPTPNNGRAILLKNVRIIDGHGGTPIESGYVVVVDGKIAALGTGKLAESRKNEMEEIDFTGKTLMPGFIDAHLHTVNDNELMQLFLENGVTSMRDPGHPFTFYQSIGFTQKPLPRIFLTGAHLDYPPVAYGQQATLVKNPEHARKLVDQYVENGATAIKIYFRLPLKFYHDVLETAQRHKIPVVAHLELVSATDAITAGVNGIEHVTSFGTSIASDRDKEDFIQKVDKDNNARREERYRLWSSVDLASPRVKDAIRLAVSKNVVLCPTLAAFEKQAVPGKESDFRVKGFQNMVKFVEMAHKAGMKIVVGSHSHVEYAEAGQAYQRELELLQMAGMTPLEIIRSGTIYNARYFGNEARLGSIEVGKAADLLLIDGNPDTDLQSLRKVTAVMLNGSWVKK